MCNDITITENCKKCGNYHLHLGKLFWEPYSIFGGGYGIDAHSWLMGTLKAICSALCLTAFLSKPQEQKMFTDILTGVVWVWK